MACQASSDFTINSVTLPQAVKVEHATAATFALVSTANVNSCSWTIVGKSRAALTYPTITNVGSPATSCTLTMPVSNGTRYGSSFRMKCTVTDANGESATTYAVFGAPGLDGLVPPCAGEETDRGVVGWIEDLHQGVQKALLGLATEQSNTHFALTGGAALATIGIEGSPVGSNLNQHATIKVRVTIWEDGDKTVQGAADFTVEARTSGSALSLGTITEDLTRLPTGSDAEISATDNHLTIKAKATANDCHAKYRVWIGEIDTLT